jgi:hypothetical protein
MLIYSLGSQQVVYINPLLPSASPSSPSMGLPLLGRWITTGWQGQKSCPEAARMLLDASLRIKQFKMEDGSLFLTYSQEPPYTLVFTRVFELQGDFFSPDLCGLGCDHLASELSSLRTW